MMEKDMYRFLKQWKVALRTLQEKQYYSCLQKAHA
jgi:hypothetical protein